MCLNVKRNWKRDKVDNRPIPLKARKNIVCYKWLERNNSKGLSTPFQWTMIKIGQRMMSELGIGYYTVNQGIHAFSSYKEAFRRATGPKSIIVECIIPKGAKYIRGMDNDIVATEMKLQRIIMEGGKLKKKRV